MSLTLTVNFFLLRFKNLKFLILLASVTSASANNLTWKQRSERYLKINFNRTKAKINSYIEKRYEIPQHFFLLRDQISQIKKISDKASKVCRKNEKLFECNKQLTTLNSNLISFAQSTRLFIKNTTRKTVFSDIKKETLLFDFFVIAQKRVASASQAVELSLSLDSLLIKYMQAYIPIESFGHVNDYFSSFLFLSKNIKRIDQQSLDQLTNTINYFIRKERETAHLSQRLKKNLELINLFWNNVLKIKKDQR